MHTKTNRKAKRQSVKTRIRRKISGDAQRPRLTAYRSLSHFYLQAVDDTTSTTLCSASTLDKEAGDLRKAGANIAAAAAVGELIGKRLKEKGIETVVFDRGGFLYHGRVKAAAEAARKAGLKF